MDLPYGTLVQFHDSPTLKTHIRLRYGHVGTIQHTNTTPAYGIRMTDLRPDEFPDLFGQEDEFEVV